jgi:hypothetical protein
MSAHTPTTPHRPPGSVVAGMYHVPMLVAYYVPCVYHKPAVWHMARYHEHTLDMLWRSSTLPTGGRQDDSTSVLDSADEGREAGIRTVENIYRSVFL